MKNSFFIFVLLLFIVQITAAVELEILTVSPKGNIGVLTDQVDVVVTFSEPMVALKATGEEPEKALLQITPSIRGKYRWMGTRTLMFSAQQSLPLATAFQVKVPAGTKALSGNELPVDYSWTFETARPIFVNSEPAEEVGGVDPKAPLYLRFNQPMDPRRIGDKIRLTDGYKWFKLQFTLPRQEELVDRWRLGDDTSHVIKATPTTPLAKGTTYTVVLAKGLLAQEGDLGLVEERKFKFVTYGPLKYLGFDSGNNEKPLPITPSGGIQFKFNNQVKPAELAKKIRFEPAVEIPEYYFDRTWGQVAIYLNVEFKPETKYHFVIPAELTDVYGNQLGKTVRDSFITASYPSRMSMVTGPGVLESYGDRRYPVFFVNKDKVKLRLGLIPPDRLIPLLNQPDDIFYREKPLPDSLFMVDRMWETAAPHNIKIAKPLEVDWLLVGRKTGLVLAEVDNMEPKDNRRYSRILLQVTGMGVSAKFSPINNVIWVTQLKDAQPVAGAKVEIRDDENRKLWSGTTNAAGIVETPGWRELGIQPKNYWDRPRQWVFVYHQLDFAYTASDWGTGIYPYRFDIDYDWDPQPLKRAGVLFTDRGLYRAGETVHIKGMLREKKYSDWTIAAKRDYVLRVNDSRGNNIVQENIKLSDYGSFAYDLNLDASASLGYYDMNISFPADSAGNEGESVLHGYFRVEAFRPAEFSVRLKADKQEYILGDSCKAMAQANFLFGAPMSGFKVTGTAYLNKGYFRPEGHEGYFFDPLDWDSSEESEFVGRTLLQSSGVLNSQGEYRFACKLDAAGVDFPLSVALSAEVRGPNEQYISANERLVVHPAEYYIGIKPTTTFIEAGKPINIEVISVLPNGTIVPGKKVFIKWMKRQWHSVRKAGVGGRYEWISKPVDTAVDSMMVTTASEAIAKTMTFKEAGVYLFRAQSNDSQSRTTVTEVYFYVSGKGYVAWQRADDDRIELIANAAKYKPGDVAKILVKSPFESAQALVTLEREGIISQQVVRLEGSTPVIQVPIENKHLPNVFVSVILIKGRSSSFVFSQEGEDVGRPAFKIGYINLPVDAGSQHLNIVARPDKENYRPGERVTLNLEVQNSLGQPVAAEMTIAVVDKGILNLINYELPDPFDAFYGMRPLSVQTSETRLHVVEQRNYGQKGENRGGGGGEEGYLDMDIRKYFKAAAYWQPSLLVDASGKAQVTFDLPDNLTTFKIMVVAQTKDAKFGRSSSELKVNQPLMLLAALPRFVRKGDIFTGGAMVHNYSGEKGNGTLTVKAEGVELVGDHTAPITLDHGESKEIRFTFKAPKSGTARFVFSCQMGPHRDALEKVIPVQVANQKETVALYQRSEKDAAEKILIPTDVDKELTQLQISLASTALSELGGSVEYLMSYPYECLEQRISRILPIIVAGDLMEAFKVPVKGNHDYRAIVTEGLKEISKFQTEEGSLSLWPGGRTMPYVTAYAAFAMTMAKEKGYEVNDGLLADILNYLWAVLKGDINRDDYPYGQRAWLTTDAFILYVLSLNGQVDAGYLDKLYRQRQDLSVTARAFLLKAIHLYKWDDPRRQQLAQDFINSIRVSPTAAYFEEEAGDMCWIFHSNVRATAQALQALMEAEIEFPMAEQTVAWLMTQRKGGHWLNTQENFYVLYALASYFERYEQTEPKFEAQVRLAGKEVFKHAFSGRTTQVQRHEVPLAQYTQKMVDVGIKKIGQGMLYYGLRLNYYPLEITEPREEGIAVIKIIEPLEGGDAAGEVLKSGSLYKVTLHLTVTKERNYVVVQDPLPAGLEAVQVSFATTSAAIERMAVEDEDSQIWWYGFTHIEKYDDRVLLFADWLSPGVYKYSYIVRATTKGTFHMPPTHAEEMYSPEVYGRTVSRKIRVE